jgi:hypothetical protein
VYREQEHNNHQSHIAQAADLLPEVCQAQEASAGVAGYLHIDFDKDLQRQALALEE